MGISEYMLHQKKKRNYCMDFYYYFYEVVWKLGPLKISRVPQNLL